MQKTAAVIISMFLMLLAVSCSNKSGTNPGKNVGVNQGTSQGAGKGNVNQNTASAKLKDGIYTGQGNMSSSGNQTATIYVRNGKIVDVVLNTVPLKGSTGSAASSGDTSSNVNNSTLNNGNAAASGSQSNRISGGNPMGGTTTGIVHDGSANGVTSGGSDLDTNPLNISQVKRNLANSVVQYQTYDVTVGTNNPALVENWKLAIRRAMDKART